MTESQLLEKFDLSPTASKVYLALLDLGKASADKIAKKAGTYKANTYDALAKLEEAGLVTSLIEQNKRFFVSTNPEKLESIIEDKKEKEIARAEELKKELEQTLPKFLARYNSAKDKDIFEIYKGKKAYKSVINEIVKENPKVWKGFGNFQIQEMFPLEFVRWFKKVQINLFSTKTDVVVKRMEEAEKITKVEVKWLPEDVYMPIVWVIFGENVLIVIYEPEIIVLRIKSKQITQTFSNQFEYFWRKY